MAKTDVNEAFVQVNKNEVKIKRLIAAAIKSGIFFNIKTKGIDDYIIQNKSHLNYLEFDEQNGMIYWKHYKPTKKMMTEEEFYQWLKDLKED